MFFLFLEIMEYYRVYNYLTRGKGSNLKHIDRNLALIPENNRFDAGRFDILAARVLENETIPTGIYISEDEFEAVKTLEKAEKNLSWIEQYNGNIILVALHDTTAMYKNAKIYFDSGRFELIRHKYENKTHKFLSHDEEVKSNINNTNNSFLDTLVKHHKAADYALGKLGKKSEVITVARTLLNFYAKLKR